MATKSTLLAKSRFVSAYNALNEYGLLKARQTILNCRQINIA